MIYRSLVVRYERYRHDYDREHCVKRFDAEYGVETPFHVANWIFGQMHRDYTNSQYPGMYFPTPEKSREPSRISFQPDFGGEEYWIHQIEYNDGTILFSDGKYTCGKKHWSKDIQDWLRYCENRMKNPTFVFGN